MPVKYIDVDGIRYVPESEVRPEGNREVVVCDKGFIFVGNVTERADGGLDLTKAANLRRWASGGFGGALTDPKTNGVELDPCPPLSIRPGAWFTRHPVPEDWCDAE